MCHSVIPAVSVHDGIDYGTVESSPDGKGQPQPWTSTTSSSLSGLWDDYDNDSASQSVASTSTELTADMELDNYLRKPRVPRTMNIYRFWNCSQFPGLEPAAKKFLCAQALFRAAGQIYSARRSSLLGENTEKITVSDIQHPTVWIHTLIRCSLV